MNELILSWKPSHFCGKITRQSYGYVRVHMHVAYVPMKLPFFVSKRSNIRMLDLYKKREIDELSQKSDYGFSAYEVTIQKIVSR